MPRAHRQDRPGLLHHVMNRGIAKRTVFEGRGDVRCFLALLARAARERRIEVHAFAVLATHFHLLVRSLDGRLSDTLRRVQQAYVRHFNRSRRRDGPLFRGRFRSFPVRHDRYARVLVGYIDQNAVRARLCATPADYPFGSARHHMAGGPRPRWLCRSLVDAWLEPDLARGGARGDAYLRAFPPRPEPAVARFVEQRLHGRSRDPDPEDLVAASGRDVLAWMRRKALLADGTRPGVPIAAADDVRRLVARYRRSSPGSVVQVAARTQRCLWDLVEAGLLRDMAGLTLVRIARGLGIAEMDAHRRVREHRDALEQDVRYARTAAEIGRRALRATYETRDGRARPAVAS